MSTSSRDHALPYPAAPPTGGGLAPHRQGPAADPFAFTLGSEEDDKPIEIRKYLDILWRRKWLLILAAAIGLVVGFIDTVKETPLYRTSATLQAAPPATNPFGYTDHASLRSSQNFLGTQVHLLKSADLAARVARDLRIDLGRDPAADDQEPRSFFADVEAFLDGWIKRLRGDDAAEQAALAASAEDSPSESEARQVAIERTIREGLIVAPVPNSNLINLTLDNPDPRHAAAIVNAVAKTYVEMNAEYRYQGTASTQRFYDDQITKTRAQLEDLERRLVAYARGKDLVNLENLLQYHEQEFTQLNSLLFEAEQRLIQAEAKFAAMREVGGGGAEVLESPLIQQLKGRRGELQDEYQRRLEVFLPEYPAMQQLETQIAAIDDQIADELRVIGQTVEIAYKTSKREVEALKERVAASREALLSTRDQTADYLALKREHSTLQAVYDGLLTRIKEAGIVADVGTNNVAIVDMARVPSKPYTPNLKANLTKALMFALVLGILVIVLLEMLDDTVKSAEEVEGQLGAPILGSMPFVAKENEPSQDSNVALQVALKPKGPLAESVRSLRTSLLFSSSEGVPKVLHFTSAAPGEGKSVAGCAVALIFAQSGGKVLCIDADLRNPSLHHIFDLQNDFGLTNYLASTAKPYEVAQPTSIERVFVITSGPLPPNPVELLSSTKMVDLLNLAAERFDHVIIDGPPIIGIADALVLSRLAGASVFVVEPGKTRKAALKDSVKRMRSSQAHIIGAVLQKIGRHGVGYGYGYGYGYKYSYHYTYGDTKSPTKDVARLDRNRHAGPDPDALMT